MNRGILLRLYVRVIAARTPPRCFRISSRVSLLTLRPTLFGPVLLGQASALRMWGGEAICLWDLSAAFYQAGHHAGAPEEDGPSFDALYQGETSQGVAFEPPHLRGRRFSRENTRTRVSNSSSNGGNGGSGSINSCSMSIRSRISFPPRMISFLVHRISSTKE